MPLFLILSLLFSLSACTREQRDWSEFKAFDAAIDINHYTFPNGKGKQVFYKVKAEYPNKDVLNFYASMINKPWVKCSGSVQWAGSADTSGNEPLYIHQIVQRWVNRDKNRLLFLAIKYRSPGTSERENPDNDIQNIYFTEYFEPNIAKTLTTIGVTCPT